MSTDLTPYRRSPLALNERQSALEIRDARRPARRATARLDAAALVAQVGLARIEALTVAEVEVCRRQGAVVDLRARMVVDGYAQVVVAELNGLALQGE